MRTFAATAVGTSSTPVSRTLSSWRATWARWIAGGLLLVIVLAASGLAQSRQADAAPDVPVTVTILRFQQVVDPDPTRLADSPGDYYSTVEIDGADPQSTRDETNFNDAEIAPYWTFTEFVEDDGGTVPVTIEMWDNDGPIGEGGGSDDEIDINPRDRAVALELDVDPSDGTWSGEVPDNVGFSEGDGDTEHAGFFEGGEVGRLWFDISVGSDGDLDDDGIPDGVERFGIRDENGDLVTDMAALGANPCRETIAVEVDYMDGADDGHTHEPKSDAVNEIVNAFDRSPRPAVESCPYPGFNTSRGIGLLVDVDDAITEQPVVGKGSKFEDIRDGNFPSERRPYFHYNLWVHNSKKNDSQSGICCNDRDFVVSLGSWKNQTGEVRDQSGTMMHELGHALGLGHGGTDGVNRKPNHLSVMSYVHQTRGIYDFDVGARRVDYSGTALPDLDDESELDENVGIPGDDSDPLWISWLNDDLDREWGRGDRAVDWDGDNSIDSGTVHVDVNGDGICVKPGDDGALDTTPADNDVKINSRIHSGDDRVCETEAEGDDEQEREKGFEQAPRHKGSNGWAAIKFRGAMASGAGGAMLAHPETDLRFEEAQRIKSAEQEALSPDVKLTKTADQDEALPGDTITYTIEVTNVGEGPATNVEVTDTLPDGSVETTSLSDLAAGDTGTATFTHEVPVGTADGTALVNTATVTATDALGGAEGDTSDNTDVASTTVTAPVPELDKEATDTVAAGEEITYTLTYRNTGGAAAEDVVISDTLPAEAHYDPALDQGAGPAPDAVEDNPDGTTTLTFDVGQIPAASGDETIEFTVRPSLLTSAGEKLLNRAELTFTDSNDNPYPDLTAEATTTLEAPEASEDPQTLGFWRNHPERLTSELLARVQATDSRYDGADGSTPDGMLTREEVEAAFSPPGGQPRTLRWQLLATYLNLAERRVVADTSIGSDLADEHGLDSVADAARFGSSTLDMGLSRGPGGTADRFNDATTLLDDINNNRIAVY